MERPRRSGRFKRARQMHAMSEINVTSLLDLCFCLLIIFMIATPIMDANPGNQQTIPLNLPTESAKEQVKPKDVQFQTISIDSVGRIFWGGKEVSLKELDRHLEMVSHQGKPPVIALRADSSIPYQKVITVLDKIQLHRLDQISLDTQTQ